MSDDKPKTDGIAAGDAPAADPHLNGPGMTNGVPDGLADGAATGSPHSDRADTETASVGVDPGA